MSGSIADKVAQAKTEGTKRAPAGADSAAKGTGGESEGNGAGDTAPEAEKLPEVIKPQVPVIPTAAFTQPTQNTMDPAIRKMWERGLTQAIMSLRSTADKLMTGQAEFQQQVQAALKAGMPYADIQRLAATYGWEAPAPDADSA